MPAEGSGSPVGCEGRMQGSVWVRMEPASLDPLMGTLTAGHSTMFRDRTSAAVSRVKFLPSKEVD